MSRLNKFLALQRGLSRREADEYIAAGRVKINGEVAILGAQISATDKISIDDKQISRAANRIYLAFNKPVGYVCSRRRQGEAPTIYELLPAKYHTLKPVGRLDKDSSGIILLTNDGDFAHQMTHPSFHKTKVYEVQLDRPLQPLHQQMISDFGVMLADGKSQFMVVRLTPQNLRNAANDTASFSEDSAFPAAGPRDKINQLAGNGSEEKDGREKNGNNTPVYQITMREGRNRQIRRTFAALGYTVRTLRRMQFGEFKLNGLKSGAADSLRIKST